MSRSLPERPNLEQLRKQAKDLLKAQKQGDASVCRILRHLDRFAGSPDEEVLKARLLLSEAQHALAREYGFKSWAALVRGVREGRRPPQEWVFSDALLAVTGAKIKKLRYAPYFSKTGSAETSKCSLCDDPATIHLTDKSEGKMVEKHYCLKHAVENDLLPGRYSHSLYPVNYSIIVPVTQEQLDRDEAVPVTLRDGSVVHIRFPRDAMEGWSVHLGPKPSAAEKFCINFVAQVVPPPAQR